MSDEQFTVFSARAEMSKDVFGVVHAINSHTYNESALTGDKEHTHTPGLVKTLMDLAFLKPGFFCDEVVVELHFNLPVTLEWVRERVRSVSTIPALREQGIEPHVFLQTLRACPMDQNSGDRDWNVH